MFFQFTSNNRGFYILKHFINFQVRRLGQAVMCTKCPQKKQHFRGFAFRHEVYLQVQVSAFIGAACLKFC